MSFPLVHLLTRTNLRLDEVLATDADRFALEVGVLRRCEARLIVAADAAVALWQESINEVDRITVSSQIWTLYGDVIQSQPHDDN